jgi:NTP pyrophosphatase (non-canonical NTP hydrolase)
MSNLKLKTAPTLADYQQYIEAMVAERGFQREDIAQKFMLLTEEVGELAKAARKRTGMMYATDSLESEVAYEAADVLMVLLDICNMLHVDLEQAFRDKEEKNKSRVWN